MATVLITGCSSGIGYEAALAFARRGDCVYACVRDLAKSVPLAKIAQQEKLNLHLRLLDVTRPDSFESFIDGVLTESGRIDVLVNNAGILHPGAWEDMPDAKVREVMETNFFGPMLLSRAVLAPMREQEGGYIIMISSLSGIAGLAGDVTYSASKFALEGATEALRHEVDRWGIHLALVQGGQYATNIFSGSLNNEELLPPDYPQDSAYRALVESNLKKTRDSLPQALHPRVVADLLLKIADSDGSQLRWPADELATRVLETVQGQSDGDRDAFLRMAGGSDWWSAGRDHPD
jgi:NAD(P)-dependent dehydrogenase (short-subunit alcohol dehydrogenase family)